MSQSPGSRKSFRDWTMVDSKGELMSDDNRSDSSDSSNEAVSLPGEDSIQVMTTEAASVPLLPEQKEELELCEFRGTEDCGIAGEVTSLEVNLQPFEISQADSGSTVGEHIRQKIIGEMMSLDVHSTADVRILEGNGCLGACCKELMESEGNAISGDESGELEDENEVRNSFPFSMMPHDANAVIQCPGEMVERAPRERNDSDSDSDFVQIDEDNVEVEDDLEQSRNGTPDRRPSIAEGFNFLGPPDGGIRDVLRGNISEEEMDYDYDYDFNEDTESSTEDIGDDRIESDQSEVGSVNTLTDVGDLSTFADIGDLPLEAGNVARNYRHCPNNRLSSVLNIILIVVTILTMGISIGLIMATDQEMEEWHNAYLVQVKKVASLEWTLRDMDQVLHESKDKANAYDSVLKSFSKAIKPNDNSIKFFSNFAGIVNNFDSCTRKQGGLSTVDCHALILPDVLRSLSIFKEVTQADHEDHTSHFTFEGNEQQMEDKSDGSLREKRSCGHYQELQEMHQSLIREQERALHWQNLYLLERRQREWERDNEDFEDRRERAQWEKEDEEEDRREKERWEREEAENDRKERLQWEKEEAENDRKERLQWEKEEQEEDQRDRERWEKERAEMDSLECLKKLMSTNLTLLRHQVTAWNVSAFDDFVNMSSLMSGITELKQSVISSVQQIWVEAEEALKKMGQDAKKGKQPYLDTSIMADYLKQALAIFRSQFDDVVNVNIDNLSGEVHRDSDDVHEGHLNKEHVGQHERFSKPSKRDERSGTNWKWNKLIGNMFKKTSKSLRKFVRTLATSWTTVKGVWGTKASNFIHSKKPAEQESTDPLPSWLPGKACRFVWSYEYELRNKQTAMVEIGSPCLWDVREGLSKLFLKEPCNDVNHYSLGCNVDANTVWRLKKDLKDALEVDENLGSRKVSLFEGREMLHLFEEFWKTWGNSELLMKSDKEWAYCQLRYWSNFMADYKDDVTVQRGKSCGRLVDLKLILEEIEMIRIQRKDWNKKHVEDVVDNGDDEDLMEHEEDNERRKKGRKFVYRSFMNYDDGVDDSGNEDEIDDDNEVGDSKMVDNHHDDSGNEDEIDDDNEVGDSKMVDNHHDDSQEKTFFTEPPPGMSFLGKLQKTNGSDDGEERNEGDHIEQSMWYLKRAQYRIKIRRAQEKAMWFFDMSEHRDEMRKEHSLEQKSAQWLFDQAKSRETLRWKDQESDWLFDRAQYRREEFAKKWSNEFESRKGNEGPERRMKMQDLSESDWLLQKDGNRREHEKKGRDGKSRFIKANDEKKNIHPKNMKRLNKQHHTKGKQKHYKEGKKFR